MHKEIAINFLKTAQWLNGEISHKLEPFDITAQQLKILSIVAQSPNSQATVNEIKAKMFDPMSNVSRLLNKLMTKKLIIKIRNQEDQRIVHIQITKAGITLMCLGKEAMDQGLSSLGKLETEELEHLSKILRKVRK
ncbi:MAG: MarR family transcriptional regulator [Cocleimonas sp.]